MSDSGSYQSTQSGKQPLMILKRPERQTQASESSAMSDNGSHHTAQPGNQSVQTSAPPIQQTQQICPKVMLGPRFPSMPGRDNSQTWANLNLNLNTGFGAHLRRREQEREQGPPKHSRYRALFQQMEDRETARREELATQMFVKAGAQTASSFVPKFSGLQPHEVERTHREICSPETTANLQAYWQGVEQAKSRTTSTGLEQEAEAASSSQMASLKLSGNVDLRTASATSALSTAQQSIPARTPAIASLDAFTDQFLNHRQSSPEPQATVPEDRQSNDMDREIELNRTAVDEDHIFGSTPPTISYSLNTRAQGKCLRTVNVILSRCAYSFMARNGLKVSATVGPIRGPEDQDWTSWAHCLKTAVRRQGIPDHAVEEGQKKNFMTIIDRSLPELPSDGPILCR